jgi:hypothetical protein
VRRWLAGALIVTLGFLASPTAVPVYDGVGTDEPYRYVGKKPAPTSASQTVSVDNGLVGSVEYQTGEQGGQFILSLSSGSLRTTGSSVHLTAEPLTPDGSPPRGRFDGNAYRVGATPPVTVTADASGFLFLRAAVMTSPNPVVAYRATPSAPWQEVPSTRYGRDNLATKFRGTGDYVVVRLPGSKPIGSSGIGLTRALFLGGGVLVLIVVTVLVLRRPRPDDDPT